MGRTWGWTHGGTRREEQALPAHSGWRGRVKVSPSAAVIPICALLCARCGRSVPGAAAGRLLSDGAASLLSWSALFTAALLHEGGHLLAAALCGVRVTRLRLDPFGARLTLAGLPTYRQEAVAASGGPAANLLTAALALPILHRTGWLSGPAVGWGGGESGGAGGWLMILFCASLALCAVNLLPVRTLDGGRMLHCLLAHFLDDRAADTVLRVTTAAVLLGLWLLSVYALLRAGNMLTLFAFSLSLLIRCAGADGPGDGAG